MWGHLLPRLFCDSDTKSTKSPLVPLILRGRPLFPPLFIRGGGGIHNSPIFPTDESVGYYFIAEIRFRFYLLYLLVLL